MTLSFPPPAGTLAAASLLAFAKYPDGTLRDGIIYHCIPRKKFDTAMKLGWLPLGACGSWDGVVVDLFAWVCECKLRLPL